MASAYENSSSQKEDWKWIGEKLSLTEKGRKQGSNQADLRLIDGRRGNYSKRLEKVGDSIGSKI